MIFDKTLLKTITIEHILSAWEKDGKVDTLNPQKEIVNIPVIHGKYLRFMADAKHNLRKIYTEYKKLRSLKYDYYGGKLSKEELDEYGWVPMSLKILKSDLTDYVDADKDILSLIECREEMQEIVDSCTTILKELQSRTYQLSQYMGWEKFIQGA